MWRVASVVRSVVDAEANLLLLFLLVGGAQTGVGNRLLAQTYALALGTIRIVVGVEVSL